MDGNTVFINQCLEEAEITLKHYKTNPYIDKFMKHYHIKGKLETRQEKIDQIKLKILDPNSKLSFKNLSDYLDELKWNGKQHIFLFSLKEVRLNYLEKLRNPEFVREQLFKNGCGELFNASKMVWEDTEPMLVGVTHTINENENEHELEGQILFKWVETREFAVDEEISGLGTVAVMKTERSVNFFTIDLKDGLAELRLQSLKPRSTPSLNQLIRIYKNEINKFVHLDYFSPVAIDPVIRKFLREPIYAVSYWKIAYPQTGELKGNSKLSLFDKLKFFLRPFFSIEMTMYRECEQECRNTPQLFFSLHGESDEVRFNAISDRDKVNEILGQLRLFSKELLKMKELKELARDYPQYMRIISAVDFFFNSLKRLRIRAKDISAMVWCPMEDILKVFKIAADSFKGTFFLKGNDSDVLVIRNCLTVKGGLQECLKRKFDKSKYKEILKPLVNPTLLGVSYVILKELFKDYITWYFESALDAVLPGVPLFFIKGMFIIIIAVLFFGAANVFIKLPKTIYDFLGILLRSFIGEEKFRKN